MTPQTVVFLSTGQVLSGRLARRGLRTLVLFLENDGTRVEIRRSAVLALATEPKPKGDQTNVR